MGRTLAIGDIHGSLSTLERLVDYVGLTPNDRLITLGDYVDRGPDSRGVLDWLVAYQRQAGHNHIALRGNHELMMIWSRDDEFAFEDWLTHGGDRALASYMIEDETSELGDWDLQIVPEEHWRFLEGTRLIYQTPTHIFVHGNLVPELPVEEQPEAVCCWEKFHNAAPHVSGKIMVCGHTPQRTGRPRDLGFAVCIDTQPLGKTGWLTCLDVETGHYWQANMRGETRSAYLSDDCLDRQPA